VPVSREHILREIQRTADANGGDPLGHQRFKLETGMRPADWGRYWPRWGDALQEAGFAPKKLQGRYTDETILEPLMPEIRRLGRIPTAREMAILRREGSPIASPKVYERYGSKRALIERTIDYCRDRPDLADVAELLAPSVAEESLPDEPEPADEAAIRFGHVYLIRSGRHYKIGRSNAVGRRERELAIQLPERATTVHTISTDDPPGIEAYWHRRFADRRANGEWFALTAADVQAFKRRKFM
jgi:hypothetical protein